MIVLLGKQAEEYVALLADLREGKLVRVSTPVAAPTAPPAPAVRVPAEMAAALPEIVAKACAFYGRSSPQAYAANVAQARRLLDAEVEVGDVVAAIAQGK